MSVGFDVGRLHHSTPFVQLVFDVLAFWALAVLMTINAINPMRAVPNFQSAGRKILYMLVSDVDLNHLSI
jgi:hypothetical protein